MGAKVNKKTTLAKGGFLFTTCTVENILLNN